MRKIKIMMAEDHHSAREAYLTVLRAQENFNIIGEAANGFELLKLVEKREPDIVLVDVEMPVMDGFKTLAILKEKFASVKPIILSMHSDTYLIAQLILCGARSYLPKNCTMEDLVLAINKVYLDGFYFNEALSKIIVTASFRDEKFQKNLHHINLSQREIEILRQYCNEKSSRQIAEELGISVNTVETHRRNIYKKTSSTTLVGLTKFAIKNGITYY